MKREPAQGEDDNQAEDSLCHFSTLFEVLTKGDPQAAVPPVEHLTGHEGVEDCCAHQGHAEVEPKEPPVLHILVKLHELGRGVEHAGPMQLALVFEGYHDEADCFRDGQDEGKNPDGDDFNGGNQGDPDSLNSAPGSHCSVPVHTESTEVQDGDAHGGLLQEGEQLAEKLQNHCGRKASVLPRA